VASPTGATGRTRTGAAREDLTGETAREIRGFILTDVLGDPTGELPVGIPLLSGVLDSLGLIHLLAFLEERFGVTPRYADVVDEHFGSLEALVAYVGARRTS
jgi:hypothetical protein